MRLEVIVSDNGPEAAILSSVGDPGAYLLELVRADGRAKAAKRLVPNPDYVGILAQAEHSPNRFSTREEIDAYISGLRSEW